MIRPPSPHSEPSRIAADPRELDSRTSDGIHVQLLWHPLDGHVSVAVNDTKTSETFELEVRHGDRALDVFHRPYAYAPETRDSNDSQRKTLTSSFGVKDEF